MSFISYTVICDVPKCEAQASYGQNGLTLSDQDWETRFIEQGLKRHVCPEHTGLTSYELGLMLRSYELGLMSNDKKS